MADLPLSKGVPEGRGSQHTPPDKQHRLPAGRVLNPPAPLKRGKPTGRSLALLRALHPRRFASLRGGTTKQSSHEALYLDCRAPLAMTDNPRVALLRET